MHRETKANIETIFSVMEDRKQVPVKTFVEQFEEKVGGGLPGAPFRPILQAAANISDSNL